jgi:hypothetical protein
MKGTDIMTKTKTTFTPVTPELTPSQIMTLFYGYQTTLLRAWDGGSAPDAFFAEALGLQSRADYLSFRDTLRGTLRHLAATQTGLARRTRNPGGDPEAQSRRAQLRPLITELIRMRRAGRVWASARAAARAAEAA